MRRRAPLSVPALGPRVPCDDSPALATLGRAILRVLGWRFEGHVPDVSRCVLIVAPHTSNWDFVVGMAAKAALGLRVRWIGKHTIFRFPFSRLLGGLGGIPVDRARAQGVVEAAVEHFARDDRLFLVLAPEGTRKKVPQWKTGFHRIAVQAGVPIFLVGLDFARKVVRLGRLVQPSGDVALDLENIQADYTATMAMRPEQY